MPTALKSLTDFLGVTSSRKNLAEPSQISNFQPEDIGPREVLLAWDAPTRSMLSAKKLSPQKNRTFLIIGAVVALLLVAMGEFLLIAVVASIVFIKNILASTAPVSVSHVLSTHGVDYAGEFYGWHELKSFYFGKDGDMDVLCIDTLQRLPGRLFLGIKSEQKELIKEIVNKYLTFIPVEPRNTLDKMYSAVSEKITLG